MYNKLVSSTYIIKYGLYIILGLVFGLQIVMVVPLSAGMNTTPFSIAFRSSIVAFCFLLLILLLNSIEQKKIHKGHIFLGIFYLIYSIRLIYDNSILGVQVSPSLQSTSHIYLFALGGTLLPIIGMMVLNNNITGQILENAIFWVSLLQCVCIAYIFYVLYGISLEALSSRHLLTMAIKSEHGVPINPIILGRAGGFLLLASFIRTAKDYTGQIVKLASAFLGLMLLIFGASRGPFVAFFLSITVYIAFYLIYSKKNFGWVLKFGSIISLLFGLLMTVYFNYEKWNISLINRIIRSFDSSNAHQGTERLDTWRAAWNQFLSSPIYGDCFVENFTFTYPHNLILEVLMSVGLIGFIPFLISLIFTFEKGWKIAKAGYPTIFFLFLYSFISILFSGSIFMSPEFWMTMTLIFIVNINQTK